MAFVENRFPRWMNWFGMENIDERIKDYVEAITKLAWQRQLIFIAATILAAFYFDPVKTFACYSAVVFTEVLDLLLLPSIRNWHSKDPKKTRRLLLRISINTVLSAGAISFFVITISMQQAGGGHFTPLFFLFAAALFAAMNNSQMMGILLLRLAIYGGAFLFIALYDIVRYNPPLTSASWLEFFTIIFVLYFILDISLVFYAQYQTRLRQMAQIKAESARTKAAYEVKSQFLSTVSHELRTPLTSIKASLDLVNAGALGSVPSELEPALAIAAKNASRLSALIDDLLDLQKIEAGEMVFHFETVNVRALVEEAIEANKGYADHLDIKVAASFPKDDIFIEGDHSRLMQVMANLLSNALKFSNEGGTVQVGTKVRGEKVRIWVRDEGVGIPENSKDKVFGKFSQVDSSDVRRVGGTGLGMSITKQIVERHEGTVDYESELGNGSTFYVELNRKSPQRMNQPEGESETETPALVA